MYRLPISIRIGISVHLYLIFSNFPRGHKWISFVSIVGDLHRMEQGIVSSRVDLLSQSTDIKPCSKIFVSVGLLDVCLLLFFLCSSLLSLLHK